MSIPFVDEEGAQIDDFDFERQEHDITDAMRGLMKWINKEGGFRDTYFYQKIMENVPSENEAEGVSIAMRLLINYLADIHQPLHLATRINYDYPDGDMWGNLFPVAVDGEPDSLHSVWDHFAMQDIAEIELPLTEGTWEYLGEISATYRETYPNMTT